MTVAQRPRAFDFGRNWQDYAERIDDRAVDAAQAGLLRLFPAETLRGATFLDIGCGSGIHALAAVLMGANVTAIDIDPISVATTEALFAAHGKNGDIRLMSALHTEGLGEFDIVYSWGVLHHTGDMWCGIDQAASHVAPNGTLALALYRKTPFCKLWTAEKRAYSRFPQWLRAPFKVAFGLALMIRLMAKRRMAPGRFLRDYRNERGMSFWHDVDDWLGGYPYQSASSHAVVARANSLGLWTTKKPAGTRPLGLFGTGCAEFVFKRISAAGSHE